MVVQREIGNKNDVARDIKICCWMLFKISGKFLSLSTSEASLGESNESSTADPSIPTTEESKTHERSDPVLRHTPPLAHVRNKISELNLKIILLSHLCLAKWFYNS